MLRSGYRIIESSMLLNGAATGMMLVDLGADVIKIESPFLGDYLRLPDTRHLHLQASKSKRSLALDLTQEAGREVFRRLLVTADAFVTNAVADRNDKLGLGYEQLKALEPDIVYCQNTGFGATGPFHEVPSHGQMMDAMGGGIPMKTGDDGLVVPDETYLRRVGSMAAAGEGIPAQVELAEHLGDVSILHLRVEGVAELLSAKVGAGHAQTDSGQTVGLVPDAAWALPFGADARLAA